MFKRVPGARLALTAIAAAMLAAGCDNTAKLRSDPPPLDDIAEAAVENGFPAFVISVSSPGRPAEIVAAGLADIVEGTPAAPDTGFHIGSVTKSFAAVSALMLVDDGRLSLDATLEELLPDSIVGKIPYHERMTVEQLLTHRTGLYSPNNDPEYWRPLIGPDAEGAFYWSQEDVAHFADSDRNEPLFEPGEDQAYGDINYQLLALTVSAVTGKPYKEYVRDNIFKPLGMEHTWFTSDFAKFEPAPYPRARGYTIVSDILTGAFKFSHSFPLVREDLADTTEAQERLDGAAGIVSTAGELNGFFRSVFDSDLLSPPSRAFLLEVADEAAPDGEEALEVLRAYKKPFGVIVTAEGDGPGANAIVAYRPHDGALVIVLANLFGRFDESDYIFDAVIPKAFASLEDG